MAKSKFPKKAVGIGSGLAIGGVLFYLFLLPIIVVSPNVVPQNTDPFTIPILTQEQEQMNQDIIDEIENLPPRNLDDEILDIANNPDDPPPLPVDEETINDLEETIIDPPQVNGTTSEDSPLEQICDIDPENILCQLIAQTQGLQLKSIVTKTDSTGFSTVDEQTFNINRLAFFVEDQTDRDFKTGFLSTELKLIGEPNTMYTGSGKVDIIIDETSIFSDPITIQIDGVSDLDGLIEVLFVSPNGATSNDLLFTFNDNFNKFANESITELNINLIELSVTDQDSEEFSIIDTDLFSMDIARDDIKILIENEEGITSRVYPSDSRIRVVTTGSPAISSIKCTTSYFMSGSAGGHVFTVTVSGSGNGFPDACIEVGDTYTRVQDGVPSSGGIQPYVVIPQNTNPEARDRIVDGHTLARGYWNFVPLQAIGAQPVTGFNLFTDEGRFLLSGIGSNSGEVFDTENILTRNQTYNLQIQNPSVDVNIPFGKQQQTQTFTCTPDVSSISYKAGSFADSSSSSSGFYSWNGQTLDPNQPTATKAVCNIP